MDMKQLLILSVIVIVVAGGGQVQANETFKNLWLSAYPDVCATLREAATNCNLCHTTAPALNPYGTDNIGQSDPTTIENLDSDGDTVANGLEILVDCTLPGDPPLAVEQDSWSGIKALFRQ